MMNLKPILVCTDGSLYARSIYQHAAWAAGRMGGAIHVLHVIERDVHGVPSDLSGNIGFDANAELLDELARLDESQARVARLRGAAILADAEKQLEGYAVTSLQRHGALVETLDEIEGGASLLVIGKRGQDVDFAKGHLGSNLERVIRSSVIPVLVASREFKPIGRVMIAFDGGASSLKAVDHAASDTLLKGLECELLMVGKADAGGAEALERAALKLSGAGFEVRREVLAGDPEEVIGVQVKERGVDLLLMGAYGHSRVRQLILGSTTTHLIRTCQVPVLLFR
jgi:nucleotide-binding universal stress UspA family protein